MAYEILNKTTGEKETMSERIAENKFGIVDFNLMIAGKHSLYSATDLQFAMDTDDFRGVMEDDNFIGDPMTLLS